MKNRLPVVLENLELPVIEDKNNKKVYDKSYGFVSIISLLSIGITVGSILAIIFVGNR